MKNLFCHLCVVAAVLVALPSAHGATVLYDAADSSSNGDGADLSAYGTDGAIFPAVTAVTGAGGGAGETVDPTNPFSFSDTIAGTPTMTNPSGDVTYATVNTLPTSITATSVQQNYVVDGGVYYGTLLTGASSTFDYYGGAGKEFLGPGDSIDAFSLTFNSAPTTGVGYVVTLLAQGIGNNLAGPGSVTFTTTGTGGNSATALPETGYESAYSFYVSDITAGDTLSVDLGAPQSGSITYFGLTVDPLASLPSVPEPSTFSAVLLGAAALLAFRFVGMRRKA